jgi:hypothetical protein
MKIGDKVKVTNAKGESFDCILASEIYIKNMAHHFGNTEPMMMDFRKVYRFIKTKNQYAKNATEYRAFQVTDK